MPYKVIIGREQTILYTLRECAAELGVSERTMRSYIQRGLIPAQKIRRKIYVWDRNLQAFVRGAKSTRNLQAVPAPEYDTAFEDMPPDPVFDRHGQRIRE